MKLFFMFMVFVFVALYSPGETGFAASVVRFKPPSGTEQHNDVPTTDTPLKTIFENLDSEKANLNKGAILWLLRENKAAESCDFSSPEDGFPFRVVRVVKKQSDDGLWRLVECRCSYEHPGRGLILGWDVAYLFDELGHLRYCLGYYNQVLLDDLNLDKRIEFLVFKDSPKSFLSPSLDSDHRLKRLNISSIQSFDHSHRWELLNVDDVPSHGPVVSRDPAEIGGEYIHYAPSMEVIENGDNKPKSIRIIDRGVYIWNAREGKYTLASQPENPAPTP